MYTPGYRFKTYAPVDAKRNPLSYYLYDRAWDHLKLPAENEAERRHLTELQDGCIVEVIRYEDGAVFCKLDSGEEGYLG